MSRAFRARALLALSAAPLACKVAAPPVTVVGPVPDVAALAGHWSGEYASPATGRAGTIEFTVAARGDSASGVVVMVPAGFAQPLRPWQGSVAGMDQRTGAAPSLLTIHLVRISGNQVSGSLEPYADPETGERLVTTFAGRMSGDTIAGTFTTTPGPAPEGSTGRWHVIRDTAARPN